MKRLLFLLALAGTLDAQNTAKFPGAVPSAADLGVARNRAETTLATGINATATSIPVASSSGFAAGSFVTIDNEILAVCSIPDGNHLNVGVSACPNVDGRGTDTANGGGAAASHLAGAKVQARIVAWNQNQVAAEVVALSSRLRGSPISIQEAPYNAKGDGATDDAAAIRAALEAAASSGKDLYCPAGTYLIGSSLGNIGTNFAFFSYKGCTIKASGSMVSMATVGGSAPPPYFKGYMSGILWDGNNYAQHALDVTAGGTLYVNGFKFDGVRVQNCTGDAIITGNHFWGVDFINLSSMNNGGWAVNIGTGDDAGASIKFFGGSFGNNTSGQVLINNAGAGGADVQFFGTSFGDGSAWAIKAGTSSSPGLIVNCFGCHIEQQAQWIRNYGVMTLTGNFMTNGSASGTLGYLIDNEYQMTIVGGRTVNGGAGAIMNPAQTGYTFAYNVLSLPHDHIQVFMDTGGNAELNYLTTAAGVTVGAAAQFNGIINVNGYLTPQSGVKAPSGGGLWFVNASNSGVAKVGNGGDLNFNINGGTSSGQIYGALTGNRSYVVPDVSGNLPVFPAAAGTGQAVCVKNGSPLQLGVCSTTVGATGACTCN